MCGLKTLGVLTILGGLSFIIQAVMLFSNSSNALIPAVQFILTLPVIYAFYAYGAWLMSDTNETRARLPTAHLISIGVVIAYLLWWIIAIMGIYGFPMFLIQQ